MFGSSPRHGDQTGQPPSGQENTKFILDKIEELDKRLTKQITCNHGPFDYKFQNSFGPIVYRKICKTCGLEVAEITMREKMEEQLAHHQKEVDRLKEAIARNFPEEDSQ